MTTTAISESLHRLTHAYKSALRESIQDQGIPLPITHIRALKAICRNPASTPQSIATRMRRDKAQITRVLNELQQTGLILKLDNPNDRRSQLLRPSPEGERIMARLNELEQETVARMTQHLSPNALETFISVARTMTDNLGEKTE